MKRASAQRRGPGPRAVGACASLMVLVACGRSPLDFKVSASNEFAGAGGTATRGAAGAAGGGAGATAAAGASGGAGTSGTAGASGGAGTSGIAGASGAADTSGTAGAIADAGAEGGAAGSATIGQPCDDTPACPFCVGGVCCDSACEENCESCTLPGHVGTCTPLPAGSVCFKAECNGNIYMDAATCDGLGNCQRPAHHDCAPYACNGSSACRTTCSSDTDCSTGECVDGACLVEGCTTDAECATGSCADGVCCNEPCKGACTSCSMPGQVGTCAPVNIGAPDPRG
ncbi:MAG TPA: hypothetical protein VK989_05450, partial [Polyangia bacterium]|nr:hypothetical protein [Polyangia bacterium]